MEAGKPAYLVTKYEKYVFVESSGQTDRMVAKSLRMVAKSLQIDDSANSSKATVTVIDDNKHQCMAFCFKLKNKKWYPAVTGNNIGFEEKLTSDKKFWFRWVEQTGDWKTVKSIAGPDMYLCACKASKVTICSRPWSLFRIRFKEDMARSLVIRMDDLPMYPSARYNERNDIEMIQDKRPMYPNTRYRKYQTNDDSTCQMVVENFKISDNGNPSKEESHPEMIQDSGPMYLKTRHRKYMWVRSKDRSTSQMVVENFKISDDRNPSKGRTRGFEKYIAVKRQLNDIHNLRPSFSEQPGC